MESRIRSHRLLMWGYDPVLLDTRCSILKRESFDVCVAVGPNAFENFLASGTEPYDLLIVCHTVPQAERQLIAAFAEQRRMPLLQITTLIHPRLLVEEVSRLAEQLAAKAGA